MSERLKGALQEFGITLALAFAIPFAAWLQGLSELPNLEAGEAALRASILSVLVAVGKFITNYGTSEVARRERKSKAL